MHRPLIVLWVLLLAACAERTSRVDGTTVATTTSVEDTGLLDVLTGAWLEQHPTRRLRVVAVGSGHALELARRGDADVVLVHDPAAESAFVAAGHGDRRRTIMRNDFVIAGPPADPAAVGAARDPLEAFRRIAQARQTFLSRGDSSGTHRKERALWLAAGIEPAGEWYREAGVGQADLLRMASERGAYALVDRGTFRFLQRQLALEILHSDGAVLDNPYSVIVASRAVDPEGALRLADWLAGDRARALIDAHGRDRFGSPLFQPTRPAAGRPRSNQ